MQTEFSADFDPPCDALLGQELGRYRVTRKLGEGGMGAVYEVEHAQLGRKAAVKVLHPRYAQNAEITRRFLNEARAVSGLSHPGLVNIFDSGELPDGGRYYLMEYLAGETLGYRMRRNAGPASPSVLRLIQQVAATLLAVHAGGIVHRETRNQNSLGRSDACGA